MYRLKFKWTISRGRDTYGYNICSLWVNDCKVSSCNGGGYDMEGTALAGWVESAFQDELKTLSDHAYTFYRISTVDGELIGGLSNEHPYKNQAKSMNRFYGMSAYIRNAGDYGVARVCLDGACGWDSIRRIVEALGFGLQYVDKSGGSTIYIMAEKEAVELLHKKEA